ncbi:MAG: 5'/3'-nucleotidase SurE [Calditrichaeota bacterium]|nr:MAG: 5'/3'-nucleotidase SurE [Calditrichota bacterium]
MPSILVVNDDGIYAPGIKALADGLRAVGEVTVVAPLAERSAVGHAITVYDPLRVVEIERDGRFFGHAVSGTPADCVKIAVKCLMNAPPDIVVSGINQGSNTATNVIYSGTVSAAAEGVIMGIPAIAVSLVSFDKKEFTYAAKVAAHLTGLVLEKGLPPRTLLNVNVPALPEQEIKDVRPSRQGEGRYEEWFDKRHDPQNRPYYWMAGKRMILDNEDDVDDVVVMHNNVAVTPIQYDLTHHAFLKELASWKLKP